MRVGDVRLRHLTDISRQPEHVRLQGRSGPSPSDDATSAHARGRHELWSASTNSILPLGPDAGAADRDVLRAERPTVLQDLEGDIERDVRVLFGDLHQDLCLHPAAIVDRDGWIGIPNKKT